MNKEQIKRELRRSACEDADPWLRCRVSAFERAQKWLDEDRFLCELSFDDLRTFYLLVAEAL